MPASRADPRPRPASAARTARDVRVVVGRLRRRMRELSDTAELTPTQTSLMSRLDQRGSATASDLAAAERIRPQSVAATLAVLDERGLIERRPDPHDGRRMLVTLSAEGRDLHRGRRRTGDEWLTRVLGERLSAAERATVVEAMALLERLVQA